MIGFIKRLGFFIFIVSFIFGCTASVKNEAYMYNDVQTKNFKKKIKSTSLNHNSKVKESAEFYKSQYMNKSYILPPLPPENPDKSEGN